MLKFLFNFIIDSLFPRKDSDLEIESIDFKFMQTNFPKPKAIPIKDAVSIYSYRDSRVKNLIWNIKYKKNDHAATLGALAIKTEVEELFKNEEVILIPIPSSKRRYNERGYNQIELILQKINDLTQNENIIYSKLLKRTVHLDSQTKKNRKNRLQSQDIFEIDENEWHKLGKNLDRQYLIIDDVLTTGQTMQQAQKILISKGCKKVLGLTLAH